MKKSTIIKLTLLLALITIFLLSAPAQAQEQTCKIGSFTFKLTPFAVVCGAAIDAINPCEFAILILLMASMLVEQDNRKRALLTGFSFIAAVFLSYFLMGIGLLEFLRTYTLSFSGTFYKIIGGVAILFGLANIKDYFWYGKGFLMEVPQRWRPKMKSMIKNVASPWGGFVVGLLISLFLLPCTSGPYIVILGMLATKTSFFTAFLYLILYNLIFILPMAVIVLAMYWGLSPEKAEDWRKNKIRLLHLIAGVILAALGIIILSGWI